VLTVRARLIATTVMAVLAAALIVASPAAASVKPFLEVGKATDHSGKTIPFFDSSFRYGGVTYPYTMVGSNPFRTPATTTVPSEVVPLRIAFADGTVFDATPYVHAAVTSPIWRPAQFLTGHTQYGDAIQRGEFWAAVHGTGYHVLLGRAQVLPTVTINVPANQGTVEKAGTTFGTHVAGKTLGLVNFAWFYGRYDHIINSYHISSSTLPILLTRNVMLDFKTPLACCVGGFHSVTSSTSGSGSQSVQTAIFADYGSANAVLHVGQTTGVFGQDINALSHEVSEWMSDPFGSNVVPAWQSPLAPQYGCNNALEVGDPLVGVAFEVNGYHPQDEAFLSWFARQSPSIGFDGRYTYLGTFGSSSPSC
jgi:hypothetical protein